jgi:WD40 repeat protein
MLGGESFEVTVSTGTVSLLLEGHSYNEIHGLAVNPSLPDEYCTTGDDGAIRVWSIEKKLCVRRSQLGYASRAIAWSPYSNVLIVGNGGDPKTLAKDGSFTVLDATTLSVLYEDRKAKQLITDIKFAHCSGAVPRTHGEETPKVFAVASKDGRVFIHDADNYVLKYAIELPSLKAQAAFPIRVDFSMDSSVIRISTSNFELHNYQLENRQLIPSANTVRDFIWQSNTSTFAWMYKGRCTHVHIFAFESHSYALQKYCL